MMNNKQVGKVSQRKKLNLIPGNLVQSGSTVYKISEILDYNSIIGTSVQGGNSKVLKISELIPVCQNPSDIDKPNPDIEDIADEDWKIAQYRYAVIKPLLNNPFRGRKDVEKRSKEVNESSSTIYRWINNYHATDSLSSLIPQKRGWKPGSLRISQFVENIIQEVIKDTYLTHQRSSAQKVVMEVKRRCWLQNIEAPHPNTIRTRINRISEKIQLRNRGYADKARDKYSPAAGKFPNAEYPLSVVQIDHTEVDIILVDDIYRKPIGRPWLTLAIDVFSRIITGYHLSFDHPSGTSVAMCVAHSILPKNEWLLLHDVEASWDVWGFMNTVHVDNGPDFRSNNFRKACVMHGINLEFRPVKRPKYGGHIERLLGTFMEDVHGLPGTTFSSIKDREGYDSDKKAVMTKSEFEKWLLIMICNVYHKRLHHSIGMSPEKKWEIGIFGNNNNIEGCGIPSLPADRHSLLLDFLPTFKRTVQQKGVSIDGLHYYSDVLRQWINASDPENPSQKRKLIFKRDPRDISEVWFYDPDTSEYYKIPFANQSLPSMSVWEFREACARARDLGMQSVNEDKIFEALTELRNHVEESSQRTKKARLKSQKRKEHEKKISPVNPLPDEKKPDDSKQQGMAFGDFVDDAIDAFEDIA